MQQMREAFPWDQAPRYALRDRDAIYGTEFAAMTRDMGIDWTRQRLPVFRLRCACQQGNQCASTRSAISVPQECWLIRTDFSVGTASSVCVLNLADSKGIRAG